MALFIFHVLLSLYVASALEIISDDEAAKYGTQIRLTDKGLEYALKVGIDMMRKTLQEKVINKSGKSGNFQYKLTNLRVTKVNFGEHELTPVSGSGMRGAVRGIDMSAGGRIWFRYKKGWLPAFKTSIDIDMDVRDVTFDGTVAIGRNEADGRPSVSMTSCSASVDRVALHFRGSRGWMYNLISPLISKVVKRKFRTMICEIAREEIRIRAKEELNTFPVQRAIDKFAKIDYRLTEAPLFTKKYMDAFLKGEFVSINGNNSSSLRVPPFETSSTSNRMLYFWISDFTLNTAGEVYHRAGILKTQLNSWDKKNPKEVRKYLNTAVFGRIISQLAKKCRSCPMSVEISSYEPPKVVIEENKFTFQLHVHAKFRYRKLDGGIDDAFALKVDITADTSISVRNGNVTGHIESFDYDAKVLETKVGPIPNLDNFMLKTILRFAIIEKTNPVLEEGFPLPKVDKIELRNVAVKLSENVIRVATDIKYSNVQKK